MDITDRNDDANFVRTSAETLRAILASATDAIITLDADQRVILFNPAAEQMFRCPAKEILGQRIDRFIPEDLRERHREHIRAFAVAGVGLRRMGAERVLTAVRTTGEHFPIEAQISQAMVGSQQVFTVIIRDITERRQAEAEREELLRSEREAREHAEAAMQLARRVQAIADAALAGQSVDDLLHALLPRVRSVLGTDTAVVLLREPDDVLRVRAALGIEEEVQHQVRVPVGQGFAGRIAAERHPIVLEHVDYERVVSRYFREESIHSLAGVPLLLGNQAIGVMHVGSIQPRRFTDDEVHALQLAAERIAIAIERAAAHEAERVARESAEAANRAKDEFLSNISHELRTPLAAMMGWVRVLRQGKLKGDRLERAFATIERSGTAQAKLIEDLLDLSRMLNARLQLEMRLVEFSTVARAAVDALRPMAEEKGVVLSIDIKGQPLPVRGDADRLQQVIWNLVHNAVKFTPTGGRVQVDLSRGNHRARLVIRDTGKGMTEEFMAHLFEPFHQAESVKSRRSGGLGLGLSIVHRLVEMHGGQARAESAGEGKGAAFEVMLPLAIGAAVAETAAPRAMKKEVLRLDGVRILVVEDDPDVLGAIEALLEGCGATVMTAASVSDAYAVLRHCEQDILVSDIRLPDADAYTLLRKIRSRRELQDLPAIAITAYAEENESRVLAAGFQRRLTKPLETDTLVATIAGLTSRNDSTEKERAS